MIQQKLKNKTQIQRNKCETGTGKPQCSCEGSYRHSPRKSMLFPLIVCMDRRRPAIRAVVALCVILASLSTSAHTLRNYRYFHKIFKYYFTAEFSDIPCILDEEN